MLFDSAVFENFKIEFLEYRVFIDEKEIKLPTLKFKLLAYFARNPDRVLTREQILNNVWGVNTDVIDRVIDSHIKGIRKKIGAKQGRRIEAIYGVGYRFRSALNPTKRS